MRKEIKSFNPDTFNPQHILETHFDETISWRVEDEILYSLFKCNLRNNIEIKEKIFELLRDEYSGVRSRAVEYFATIRADDAKIKEKIFELLRDESFPMLLEKSVQDVAIEYLSKHARKESLEKAVTLFDSKDEKMKRGVYKLMKNLLAVQ